ncbi:MAG: FtsW/RodA/SpoVE family cell cycle protein, partial [Verrucomicrobiota bacterium]|nr:FtsW/RodA/SpoVE family cell cycle protein [Verrucomicrobiota bacterium]
MESSGLRRADLLNPLCILLLGAIGILFIYSAQISNGGDDWKKQLVWITLGSGVYIIIASINYKIFLKYAHLIYAAGIVGLLCATKLSPISVEMMGARRWVDIGIITVQPTEGAKIGT